MLKVHIWFKKQTTFVTYSKTEETILEHKNYCIWSCQRLWGDNSAKYECARKRRMAGPREVCWRTDHVHTKGSDTGAGTARRRRATKLKRNFSKISNWSLWVIVKFCQRAQFKLIFVSFFLELPLIFVIDRRKQTLQHILHSWLGLHFSSVSIRLNRTLLNTFFYILYIITLLDSLCIFVHRIGFSSCLAEHQGWLRKYMLIGIYLIIINLPFWCCSDVKQIYWFVWRCPITTAGVTMHC